MPALKIETAASFRRDAALPGVPAGRRDGSVPHRQGWHWDKPPAPAPTNGSCFA